jgi:hypothetical protein
LQPMLDFQAIRLLHRHGNGEYASMREVQDHSAASHDPERAWMRGSRLFSCESCTDEVLVVPATESKGEAPEPSA